MKYFGLQAFQCCIQSKVLCAFFSGAPFFSVVLWEEAGAQGHGKLQTRFSQPWGQQCPLHRLSLCDAYMGLVRNSVMNFPLSGFLHRWQVPQHKAYYWKCSAKIYLYQGKILRLPACELFTIMAAQQRQDVGLHKFPYSREPPHRRQWDFHMGKSTGFIHRGERGETCI